jgi:hypothetical protein
MVTSIVPGATGANALGVDTRLARGATSSPQRRDDHAPGDRVELSGASLASARESVRTAVAQLHEALALGRDAQAMLVNVQSLARDGGGQGELDATLAAYGQRVAAAAGVASGQDLVVQAEPGAAAVTITGVDLRLGGDVIGVTAEARIDDPSLAQSAQRSLDALQEAMGRLAEAERALEAHQGFLNAAEGASTVVRDLDADGARLLALQVRQGLESVGHAPIANVEPQAVLSLFRA